VLGRRGAVRCTWEYREKQGSGVPRVAGGTAVAEPILAVPRPAPETGGLSHRTASPPCSAHCRRTAGARSRCRVGKAMRRGSAALGRVETPDERVLAALVQFYAALKTAESAMTNNDGRQDAPCCGGVFRDSLEECSGVRGRLLAAHISEARRDRYGRQPALLAEREQNRNGIVGANVCVDDQRSLSRRSGAHPPVATGAAFGRNATSALWITTSSRKPSRDVP
jgi:hypothetical protein